MRFDELNVLNLTLNAMASFEILMMHDNTLQALIDNYFFPFERITVPIQLINFVKLTSLFILEIYLHKALFSTFSERFFELGVIIFLRD